MFDFLNNNRSGRLRFGNESPAPKAAIMTSFRMPCAPMLAITLVIESAISLGGETTAENGLSLARFALSVTMTAVGGSLGFMWKAAKTSVCLRGDPERSALPNLSFLGLSHIPFTIVNPIFDGKELGSRTSAVMVWPGHTLTSTRIVQIEVFTSFQGFFYDKLARSAASADDQYPHNAF